MASWEFLGKYKEVAIVKAAAEMMPGVGVFLIVFGGVLSTVSALNATVLASSRVAFSLARDRWLPTGLAAIHEKRRTPHVAILVTGAIFLVTAVLLPVDALGSAASVMFLLVFAMVNLALVALRRKQPNLARPFRIPLYPILPIAGFSINLFLALYQYVFDPRPWYIVIGWTLVGLLLYFAVFERKRKALGPQVIELERPIGSTEKERFRIQVTLANPDTVGPLIDVAAALARQKEGEIVALTVALVPEQLPIREGLKIAHHRKPLIRAAAERAKALGVPLTSDLRVAHQLEDAIYGSVQSHKADLLVMGWKGFSRKRDRIFGELTDQMIRHCPCDLALVKVVPGPTHKILLATAGGPNATLGADFTKGFAALHNATRDACIVIPKDADEAREREALERIGQSLAGLDPEGGIGRRVIRSNSVAAGLAKASKAYDLMVIGAAKTKPFANILVGDIPAKAAKYSPKSVILFRRWQGPVSGLFRKLFG
jgi:nucleotide-binding universal stress UspA family protein